MLTVHRTARTFMKEFTLRVHILRCENMKDTQRHFTMLIEDIFYSLLINADHEQPV